MGPQAFPTRDDEQHHHPPLGPRAGAACQELLLEESIELWGPGAACKVPGAAAVNRLHDCSSLLPFVTLVPRHLE